MGRKAKIDLDILADMLRDNKPLKDIAAYFDCSAAAISQRKKELAWAVKKNVAAERAPEVVEKKLNAIGQLQKISDHANWLLDHVMRWIKGDDEAIQVLEGKIRLVNVGTREEPERVEEFKFDDPHKIALAAMGEIRGQIRLQMDIAKTLYDAEAMQEFQKEIIELLREVDPDLRRKFIDKIRHRHSVRLAVEDSTPN